jgi:hypothetical protein
VEPASSPADAAWGQPPEDELSSAWDTLSGEERLEVLRRGFASSMARVDAGEHTTANVARARDALTVLRSELYSTPDGSQEHRRYELRLERAERRLARRRDEP